MRFPFLFVVLAIAGCSSEDAPATTPGTDAAGTDTMTTADTSAARDTTTGSDDTGAAAETSTATDTGTAAADAGADTVDDAGCYWVDATCASPKTIAEHCTGGKVAKVLERCDLSLLDPIPAGYADMHKLNGCTPACSSSAMHVTFKRVRCCPP